MVGSVRWWWRWLRRNLSRNSAIVKSRSRRRQCCKSKKVPLVTTFYRNKFHFSLYKILWSHYTCRKCGGSIFEVFVGKPSPRNLHLRQKQIWKVFVFLMKLKNDPSVKLYPKEWAENPQSTKNCTPIQIQLIPQYVQAANGLHDLPGEKIWIIIKYRKFRK